MPDSAVSIDEFMSRRKTSSRGDVLFKYKAAKAPASWSAETRTACFVMSTQEKDRDGDVVFTSGIDLSTFLPNPICLLNHRSADPIGTWSNVSKQAKQMVGDATLGPAGVSPECDKIAGLIGAGIVRAASIGFIPRTLKRIVLEDGTPTWSFEIIACELIECSIVSLPANPLALAKDLGPLGLARDLIEEVLDTYAKDPATGLIVPRAEFEAAHKTLTGEKTSAVIAAPDVDAAAAAAVEKAFAGDLPDSFLTRIGKALGLVKAPEPPPAPPAPATAEEKAAALAAAEHAVALADAALAA